MSRKTDYKTLYYKLFNDVTDVIQILESGPAYSAEYAAGLLKQCQIRAEERYLSLTEPEEAV